QPGMAAVDAPVLLRNGQPVPEAAVDGRLGGPERRERAARGVYVVQLAAHHRAEHASTPVRRADGHAGDAGDRRCPAAGQHEVEWLDAGGRDEDIVLEGGEGLVLRKVPAGERDAL